MNAALAIAETASTADFTPSLLRGIGAILLYAVAGSLLMLLGFYAIDLTTPGKLSMLVRTGMPNAVIVTAAGLLAMSLIVVVAIHHRFRPRHRADQRTGLRLRRDHRASRGGAAARAGHPHRCERRHAKRALRTGERGDRLRPPRHWSRSSRRHQLNCGGRAAKSLSARLRTGVTSLRFGRVGGTWS